ncbi:hypothetical protein SA2016_0305 [Sinomonas atrocyanea]|uniref:Uncharacterized protein n=1 Tax=Sinomonas atrocyanea TaxID=37927 RepID=A0A126ZVT3_9MICC|nr:hypothetical protein [Sinomonas atrocyanea]AMM31006.1 hypothetical protein SA2016_0305 [Sinomonas atrocyanea]GEB63248.1 hypothetical protein SAT01_06960 [Sinomonas atrocyanea]GGG69670.1 hypothetical protein GCM10007172_22290 [Sinomonas atrocyanea]
MVVQVVLPLDERVTICDLWNFLSCIPDTFDVNKDLRKTEPGDERAEVSYLSIELEAEEASAVARILRDSAAAKETDGPLQCAS